MEAKQMEQEIVKLLMALGFRKNGYDYYKKMLLILLNDNIKLYCITDFYKRIAVGFRTTDTKVEHAMRAAIFKITKNKVIYSLNDYFGIKVIFDQPSISGFINILVEYLREFRNCYVQ